MKWLKAKWAKFWDWVAFCYWDGISDGALSREKELREHIKKQAPKIRNIQNHYFPDQVGRYGCPQDYKSAQEFIDSL